MMRFLTVSRRFWSGIFCCAALTAAAGGSGGAFGMQSHFEPPSDDFSCPDAELRAMRGIGVTWLRSDLPWKPREPESGVFHYERSDAVLDAAEKSGVGLLPILYGGSDAVPAQYRPLMEHLDAVERDLRALVRRYRGRIQYWEISDEEVSRTPAVSGKGAGRNPEAYMKLLTLCSRVIREEDSAAKVVMGGASSPESAAASFSYLERLFELGLKEVCDVIAVCPYLDGIDAEEAYPESLGRLHRLQKKYGALSMEVWADGIGEANGPVLDWQAFFAAAFRTAGIVPEERELAVVYDPDWWFFSENRQINRAVLGRFRWVREILIDDLAELDPETVLLWNSSGHFPPHCFGDVAEFAARGGCIVFPKNLPFYTESRSDRDGEFDFRDIGTEKTASLHIGWETFRTAEKRVPETLRQLDGPGATAGSVLSGRVLSGKNLKSGDKLIPVLLARDTVPPSAVGGVFKLDSDLKGTIIMNAARGASARNLTVAEAGEELPRQFLLLRAFGVNRVFICQARQYPHQTESTFGVFNPALRPLPAALGLATVMEVFPDGTKFTVVRAGAPWIVRGDRPDGKIAWAIWNPRFKRAYPLRVFGSVEAVIGNLGERFPFYSGKFIVRPSITYLVGPTGLALR